jgi:hypothetical protein
VENNLDTLVIALYVKIDDEREGLLRLPGRPPTLSHSELICLAVMQAMLGFESEARWLRYARGNLRHLFPFIPLQPGYNKRLRAALSQIKRIIRMLGRDTDFWEDPCLDRRLHSRSLRHVPADGQAAGSGRLGQLRLLPSHSRWFWGLRSTSSALPPGCRSCGRSPTRKSASGKSSKPCSNTMPSWSASGTASCSSPARGFASRAFERSLSEAGITLLRPSRKDEAQRPGEPGLKQVRQLTESVDDTLKGQLDLEQHGGRTVGGVSVRIAQRILALTVAIWQNFRTGQEIADP